MSMKKRWISGITALVMLLSLLPVSAFAAEEMEPVVIAADEALPDNDELFAAYVESVFYGNSGAATFSTGVRSAYSQLEPGAEQELFTAVKAEIQKLLSGERSSTVFEISLTNALDTENYAEQFSRVMSALMLDCPLELFWFDKTSGYSLNGATSAPVITMKVAAAYRAGDDTNVFDVVSVAYQAAVQAQAVVADAEMSAETDHEKLVYYCNYICETVKYNDDAAKDDYAGGYGDPWQLIYVFDGDPETNVVCEGYAKAFQYLCDLTWTSENPTVQCYTVSGKMDGGNHMWNIVTLEGKNYLVDVTNCDEGTAGAPNWLFMAAPDSGNVADGYTMYIPRQVTVTSTGTSSSISSSPEQEILYAYDADAYWDGESVLTLTDTSYGHDSYIRYTDMPETLYVGDTVSLMASAVNADDTHSFSIPFPGDYGLPAGLTLNEEDGTITGTLTAASNETQRTCICAAESGTPSIKIYTYLEFPAVAVRPKAEVTAVPAAKTLTYNGGAQTLVSAGTASRGTMVYALSEEGEYTADIPAKADAGTYTVYYKAKGTDGTADSDVGSVDVTISPKSITDAVVTLDRTELVYDGAPQTVSATVTLNGKTLVGGTDYTVSGNTQTAAGTYEVTVTGANNYKDSPAKVRFTIKPMGQTVTFTFAPAEITYGEEGFTVAASTTGTGAITYSGNNDAVAIVNASTGEVAIKGAGEVTITASAPASENYGAGSASYTLTVNKAAPVFDWNASSASATYDGSAIVADTDFNEPAVTLKNDDTCSGTISYSYAAAADGTYTAGLPANAGTWYIKASVAAFGNYTAAESAPLTFTINKATPVIVFDTMENRTYDGKALPAITAADFATLTGVSFSDLTITWYRGDDTPVGADEIAYVGTYYVKASVAESGNYDAAYGESNVIDVMTASQTPAITPTASITPNGTLDLMNLVSGNQGSVSFDMDTMDYYASISDNILTTTDAPVGKEIEIDLSVAAKDVNGDGTNEYNEYRAENAITVTVVDKKVPVLTVPDITKTYDGKALTAGDIKGASAVCDGETVAGSWSLASAPTHVTDSGSCTVCFTPSDTDTYETVTKTITVTIHPAVLTVTADNKTMVVGSTVPELTFTASGWVSDEDGWMEYPVLSCEATSSSAAGTYPITISGGYAGSDYTFTYIDGALTVKEKAIVPPVSYPTGGNTEVNKNPDGSTTTTTTNPTTGEVTEVTKATDGTTATVVTDKIGTVKEITATVPTTAAQKGETVTLPIEVNRNDGTEIALDVPRGGATVEIPVVNTTAGTVAVIVHADGTEEIIRDSIPTEDGVVVDVDGDVTIKIVDNSRDFRDVPNTHTFDDAVDFASARGIIEGYSDGAFGVASNATSAACVTVIARMMGENFYGSGSTAKAKAWAEGIGLADGLNLSGYVTREQYMILLWRAAGSPDATNAVDFADADSISAAARDAMAWAVEIGLIGGYSDGSVRPGAGITRGAMAAIAQRYMTRK